MSQIITSDQIDRVSAPLPEAWTLPPAAYTSAEIYQKEVENIFQREWTCVGRVEQLPNVGDYKSYRLFGQPIVVVRTQVDEIMAMSSVCLHRAMPVVEGEGHANRFVCPYHKWTYELDGRLRSAPMMQEVEKFSTEDCRLPVIKLETWLGFIFVNLHQTASPLEEHLTDLESQLAIYDFAGKEIVETLEFDSPWNWKLLVEKLYGGVSPYWSSRGNS